jgi:hypothetical protein
VGNDWRPWREDLERLATRVSLSSLATRHCMRYHGRSRRAGECFRSMVLSDEPPTSVLNCLYLVHPECGGGRVSQFVFHPQFSILNFPFSVLHFPFSILHSHLNPGKCQLLFCNARPNPRARSERRGLHERWSSLSCNGCMPFSIAVSSHFAASFLRESETAEG